MMMKKKRIIVVYPGILRIAKMEENIIFVSRKVKHLSSPGIQIKSHTMSTILEWKEVHKLEGQAACGKKQIIFTQTVIFPVVPQVVGGFHQENQSIHSLENLLPSHKNQPELTTTIVHTRMTAPGGLELMSLLLIILPIVHLHLHHALC